MKPFIFATDCHVDGGAYPSVVCFAEIDENVAKKIVAAAEYIGAQNFKSVSMEDTATTWLEAKDGAPSDRVIERLHASGDWDRLVNDTLALKKKKLIVRSMTFGLSDNTMTFGFSGNTITAHQEHCEYLASKFHVTQQDPDYPHGDWKYEVANGDTKLEYWDWLWHKWEMNGKSMPAPGRATVGMIEMYVGAFDKNRLGEGNLDDLIHDIKWDEASAINARGLEGQLRFVHETGNGAKLDAMIADRMRVGEELAEQRRKASQS